LVVIAAAVAVKVDVVVPASTITEAGAVRALVILLERATVVPPEGADWEIVTVQVVDADEASETLTHDSELTDIVAVTEIATDLVPPFRVAVRFEVWLVVTVAAVAVKVAVAAPPVTVTDGGTAKAALTLLASATVVASLAVRDNVTVQLVVAGPVNVVLAQVKELTAIGAVTEIAKDLLDPFRVAVMVEL